MLKQNSATFVLFLLEKYGEDRFRRLWYNHPHYDSYAFIDFLETMYGRNITELENAWKEWVNEKVEKMNVGIEYEYNQILTANWRTTESEYFVVHHKADEKPSKEILSQMDALYSNLNHKIRLNPLRRIDYYKCSDFDEMYFMFGKPNSYGGLACETTIVSLIHPDSFQIAYSLVKRLNCRYEPILDGAVFILAAGGNCNRNDVDSIVKRSAEKDSLISLVVEYETISCNRTMKKQFRTQWQSFCNYLVLNYGLEAFIALVRNNPNRDYLLRKVTDIYRKDLISLQREWIESLRFE